MHKYYGNGRPSGKTYKPRKRVAKRRASMQLRSAS